MATVPTVPSTARDCRHGAQERSPQAGEPARHRGPGRRKRLPHLTAEGAHPSPLPEQARTLQGEEDPEGPAQPLATAPPWLERPALAKAQGRPCPSTRPGASSPGAGRGPLCQHCPPGHLPPDADHSTPATTAGTLGTCKPCHTTRPWPTCTQPPRAAMAATHNPATRGMNTGSLGLPPPPAQPTCPLLLMLLLKK